MAGCTPLFGQNVRLPHQSPKHSCGHLYVQPLLHVCTQQLCGDSMSQQETNTCIVSCSDIEYENIT